MKEDVKEEEEEKELKEELVSGGSGRGRSLGKQKWTEDGGRRREGERERDERQTYDQTRSSRWLMLI